MHLACGDEKNRSNFVRYFPQSLKATNIKAWGEASKASGTPGKVRHVYCR